MTPDEANPFGEDVLRALRQHSRAQAPAAARARVAARLSGAGVGVLATAASAAAASTLKASGAASTLSALALTKTFALGLALGVGTAVTTYAVSSSRSSGLPEPAIASTATIPAASALSPFPAERAATRAETELPINPVSELPRSTRGTTAAPSSGARTEATVGLAEQQSALDGARKLLRTGDASQALDVVEQHRRRFPRTAFAEEREALAIRALIALGRGPEARARTAAFARSFPGSLALSALQKANVVPGETVMEPNALPQTPSKGSALR